MQIKPKNNTFMTFNGKGGSYHEIIFSPVMQELIYNFLQQYIKPILGCVVSIICWGVQVYAPTDDRDNEPRMGFMHCSRKL